MVRRPFVAIGLVRAVALVAIGGCVLTCVLAVGSWGSGPTCKNTPSEMFEGTLAKPVPDGVGELQGTGDMWQSYAVWLRFRASDAAIAEILRGDFARISHAEAEVRFRLPRGYDRFSPRWSPPAGQVECYRAARQCAWSSAGGRQWLLIDRSAGIVYAYAEGD